MARVQDRRRQDQEQEVRHLWDAHHDAVLRYCRRRTTSDEAADAVAETYAIAWQKLDLVPDGPAALYWLYAVAGRVISNQRRKGTRRTAFIDKLRGSPSDSVASPESIVVRRAVEQQVVDAAASLKAADREILLLVAWEELPHAAVAEVLGLSVAAVAQRLARAKKRLAKEFDSRGPYQGSNA